jgi:predicted ATPase
MTRTRAAVMAAVALLSTGCQPTNPSDPASTLGQDPAATPAYRCTPVGGATAFPSPCTSQQFEQQKTTDARYAEAERVYRAYFAEDDRLTTVGEVATPTVLALLASPLREDYKQERQKDHDLKVTSSGGESKLAYLRRQPVVTFPGAELALSTCGDATAVTIYRAGQPVNRGKAVAMDVFFKTVDGQLRIMHFEGEIVSAC